jgi:predicted Zn finger-like uncharacterized protein
MKAQCPSCKALFNIDDSKIPEKGAHVTCTKCKTRFEVKKPAPAQAAAAQPSPARETPVTAAPVHTGSAHGREHTDIHAIITCPACGHVNISVDKCAKCGLPFSADDKTKYTINI